MADPLGPLSETFGRLRSALNQAREGYTLNLEVKQYGKVEFAGSHIVLASGLSRVRADEVLKVAGIREGLAFDVEQNRTGVVMLDFLEDVSAGQEVWRTGKLVDAPVGEALLGRIVDIRGRPLDDKGPVRTRERLPMERPAPPIMDRAPVETPLKTGLKVVDALIPVGRGQRELILGDRQTGKSAVALDTILNQKGENVVCVYCAVGKRISAVLKAVRQLEENGAMAYTIVLVATEEDPPGVQFLAPYAATSMAEYFMERGGDALIVYDDLTRHARAYREMSLLLRRPPGREAYPGDIFYIHSRLLERSTHLREEKGGGSLTALPIIETEAQNISAYIPTNLISITDGQIYLSPTLFQKGVLPAVDVGRSVSRVGGKTQLPAYRAVAGDLRLSYSQFEELESFSRFGTRLDEDTRQRLNRGRRVREVLKQPQSEPLSAVAQIAVLVALNAGVFDQRPLDGMAEDQRAVREAVARQLSGLAGRIEQGDKLSGEDRDKIVEIARQSLEQRKSGNGNH